MDSKIIKLFIILFFITVKSQAVEFKGKFIQGYFILGKTEKNSKVFIDKKEIKVTQDGYFVFGLGRDRKYDVVTSRIYEAAAGGAVVIAYNSDFIKKEFGDCVLFIDYPLHSHENVSSQIINHFKWIKKNPLEAKEKANKLQEIFLKKFFIN